MMNSVTKNDLATYLQGMAMAIVVDGGRFFLYYFCAPLLGVFAARVGGAMWEKFTKSKLYAKWLF